MAVLSMQAVVGCIKAPMGGKSWVLLESAPHDIRAVAVDAVNPDIVYAATLKTVFKSSDGGVTWEETNKGLRGCGARSINAIEIAAGMIYIGTYEGVFYRKVD